MEGNDMYDLMDVLDIAFPNLGIYLKNVPKDFSIFGFPIAFYGLFVGLGVIAGILMASCQAARTGQDREDYWDLAFYAVTSAIIGTRAFYVIFRWDAYKDNLLSIFNLRNGGLAVYGGVIGGFAALFVYCKLKKKNALLMGDTAVPGLILGQIIGRLGNFTNREVFGEYTDNLLAMRLPVRAVRSGDISGSLAAHIPAGANYIQAHPTFLYEMIWNLMILTIMLLYTRHKKFHGQICLIYLGGYGLGRFFIEGIRTDQLFIPGTQIPVNQVLAMGMFLFSVLAWICVFIKKRKFLQ
jgi:phosphatidylglycerol:prolipoprotein diacylglycerol transferase